MADKTQDLLFVLLWKLLLRWMTLTTAMGEKKRERDLLGLKGTNCNMAAFADSVNNFLERQPAHTVYYMTQLGMFHFI